MAKTKAKNRIIKYKVPTKKQPVWTPVSKVLKWFYKKPTIINLNEQMPQKALYLANHSAMNGPVNYSLHFPAFLSIWGAYPMLGNYGMRYRYYRDVFCIQKKGMNKVLATIIAVPVAALSIFFYRGMKVLPTYPDGRFRDTIKNTIECLDNDVSVIMFPENSDDGYHDVLKEFLPGFVMAAQRYDKIHEERVPLCPVYWDNVTKTMVIGKPSDLSDKQDWSREQICEHYRCQVNDLFYQYIEPLRKQREEEKLAKKNKKSKKQSKKQTDETKVEE